MGGEDTKQEPSRCPGIAEIEQILRLDEPTDSDAVHRPSAVADWRSMRTERIDGCGGCLHVLALEKARDLGSSNRERPQHQRAMRDRLIAGDADLATKRQA